MLIYRILMIHILISDILIISFLTFNNLIYFNIYIALRFKEIILLFLLRLIKLFSKTQTNFIHDKEIVN